MYSSLHVRIETPSFKAFSKEAIAEALKEYEGMQLEVSERHGLIVPHVTGIETATPHAVGLAGPDPLLSGTGMLASIQFALDRMEPAV